MSFNVITTKRKCKIALGFKLQNPRSNLKNKSKSWFGIHIKRLQGHPKTIMQEKIIAVKRKTKVHTTKHSTTGKISTVTQPRVKSGFSGRNCSHYQLINSS